MERARDGDLERLEPVREIGRFASAEAALRKGSRGRSTRTGRGILEMVEGWRVKTDGAEGKGASLAGNKTRPVTMGHVTQFVTPASLVTISNILSCYASSSSCSTGMTTSNTPVPHRIGRPITKFPDGV
jgi:hypothetical protein